MRSPFTQNSIQKDSKPSYSPIIISCSIFPFSDSSLIGCSPNMCNRYNVIVLNLTSFSDVLVVMIITSIHITSLRVNNWWRPRFQVFLQEGRCRGCHMRDGKGLQWKFCILLKGRISCFQFFVGGRFLLSWFQSWTMHLWIAWKEIQYIPRVNNCWIVLT